MAFSTNLAPGAAGYGNYTMAVAADSVGRIFYNWWLLGEGGHEWIELEGDERTDASPAASFVFTGDISSELDMWSVVKGTDGNIYYNSGGGFGRPFHTWEQIPGLQTNVTPAATVMNNGITPVGAYLPVVIAKDIGGRIFYYKDWNTWVELDGNGQTDAAPAAALVSSDYGYLFVAMKGLNNQLYLNQGELGQQFTGWNSMSFNTYVAPAAASAGITSAVVATSTDGRIFYNWWKLGDGPHEWCELDGDGRTDAAPAAALVGDNNDYLFVVIKGLNNQLYLNQGELGGMFVGWQAM